MSFHVTYSIKEWLGRALSLSGNQVKILFVDRVGCGPDPKLIFLYIIQVENMNLNKSSGVED